MRRERKVSALIIAACIWFVAGICALAAMPPAAATDRAFGDSLTDTTGQAVTSYIAELNAGLPTTFVNLAHGGSMVGDQTPVALGVNVAAGDRSIVMLGVNDERIYGVDTTKQGYYRDGLRNLIGWLALANKQTARSTGCNPPWSVTQIHGVGCAANTIGASRSFTVEGTTAYLAVILADSAGNNAPYSISIDGASQGTFSSSAPGVTSYIGYAYTDRLHRFPGLSPGSHTITATQTGAGNFYVEWAAGNQQTSFPQVFVGNIIRSSNTPGLGYNYPPGIGSDANVISYNADIAQIVAEDQADGLAVTLVDVYSQISISDLSPVDWIHPAQSGQDKLSITFKAAMIGGASLTFSAVPIYRRLINGVADGTYWIDDGTSRRQLTLQ